MSAIRSYFYPEQEKNATIAVSSAPPSPPPERVVRTWALWKPRTWGKKTYLALAALVVVIIIAAVVPAVTKKSKGYPNYYKLNYKLQEAYTPENFFSNFDFYTKPDPTQGFVNYVSSSVASSTNLTSSNSTSATIRVDTANTNATSGRNSIRLVSKNAYNGGLFIFDVAHVPYGCGTWPAIWMTGLGPWPSQGEIDIMESVNQGGPNQMTLHTTQGCSMQGVRNQTGTALDADCYVGQDFSQSCAVIGSSKSAGQPFNSIGGGVYAMEWRSEGIRIWFFERSQIPSNIASPDPSVWPIPSADFPNTNCDIGSHFSDLHIVTNIALCGVWAGAESVYNEEDRCPNTCSNYVALNATAFEQAYFTYNSFKIYSAN